MTSINAKASDWLKRWREFVGTRASTSPKIPGAPAANGLLDSTARRYQQAMENLVPVEQTINRFHCRPCGLGDFEVGHLSDHQAAYCLICLEEDDVCVKIIPSEESVPVQARFLKVLVAAG